MKHTWILIFASGIALCQDFSITPNRDGSYSGYFYNSMPTSTYTPRLESIARSVIPMEQQYSWDELGNKYPVKNVVPTHMLPVGAQRQLEEEQRQMLAEKVELENRILEGKKREAELMKQDNINSEAANAIEEVKTLDVNNPAFTENLNNFRKKYQFGSQHPVVSDMIGELVKQHDHNRNLDLQTIEINRRKEEALDISQKDFASKEAASMGDDDLMQKIASAPTGEDALKLVSAKKYEKKHQALVSALTEAGVTNFGQFYTPQGTINEEMVTGFLERESKKQSAEKTDVNKKQAAFDRYLESADRIESRIEKRGDGPTESEKRTLSVLYNQIDTLAKDLNINMQSQEKPAPEDDGKILPPPNTTGIQSGINPQIQPPATQTQKPQAPLSDQEKEQKIFEARKAYQFGVRRGDSKEKRAETLAKINNQLSTYGIPAQEFEYSDEKKQHLRNSVIENVKSRINTFKGNEEIKKDLESSNDTFLNLGIKPVTVEEILK